VGGGVGVCGFVCVCCEFGESHMMKNCVSTNVGVPLTVIVGVYTHTLQQHTHTLQQHTHTLQQHTHTLQQHTHTL